MNRRQALFSLSAAAALVPAVRAAGPEMTGLLSEADINADHLPQPAQGGFRVLRDAADRATLAAAFDRLIPADAHGPSATEAGCLHFIDDQLAGDYGAGKSLYLAKPLDPANEAAIMGSPQFLATPRERYRTGIQALEVYARAKHNAAFASLSAEQIDAILTGMENGSISFGGGVDARAFFELMLQNVREGYLADPLYGGNKDMVGWKMIGFPGARYDYRRYIERRGENLGLTPVSLVPQA
jgi:gluconate 2-dehydrogenase gamma chain